MGSKARIAKEILPIMLKKAKDNNITTWVEPFVGGANLIDKVPSFYNRIGYDYNNHVIQAMCAIRDMADFLPEKLSEEDYKKIKGTPPEPITSWLRFVGSFAGKFEAGYAREKGSNEYTFITRGKNNAKKQSKAIQGVQFIQSNYKDILFENPSLVYCDPPYEGTTGYNKTINHKEFWEWCRNLTKQGHIVFVSEYNAPDDFVEVWKKEIQTNFDANRTDSKVAVEKIFKHKSQL